VGTKVTASIELRRRFLGRAVQPLSLAIAIATAVGAIATIVGTTVAFDIDGRVVAPFTVWPWIGYAIGGWSAITSATMWVAWWTQSSAWLNRGLLWSTGVFFGAAVSLAVEGLFFSAALAGCWIIAGGGAYFLEAEDLRGRRDL